MTTFLLNPQAVNYVLLGLYVLNTARWAYARSWADVVYWTSAIGIQISLTFLYRR